MTAPWLAPDVCRLDQVATIDREGVAASAIEHGTTYVGLENIDSDGEFVDVRPVSRGELASNKFLFGPRHILFGKLRPYLRKTARPDFEGVCSTDIVPILPGPRIDRDYLFHFLRHPKTVEQAVMRCAGANLPRLSPKDLASFGVPVPALSEQRRIADILDKADAVRRKRKQAIALTDELLRSAFLCLFGDPVANPKGWQAKSLAELDVDFSYGTSVKCGDHKAGRAVLRIPNVVNGVVSLEGLKYADLDANEAVRFSLQRGDLLLVRTNGNPNYIARCAVFSQREPMLFASYLIRARLPKECPVTPVFTHAVFSAASFRAQLLGEATTTAGNYNINTKALGRQRVPLPPRRLQEHFGRQVQTIQDLRNQSDVYEHQSGLLFASLVARAFENRTVCSEASC